jgi:hypothetical protein
MRLQALRSQLPEIDAGERQDVHISRIRISPACH